MKYFLGFLTILLLLQNCTIEKRHYTSGFHVEWKHSQRHNARQEQITDNDPKESVDELIVQKEQLQSNSGMEPVPVNLEASVSNTPIPEKKWKQNIKEAIKTAKPKSIAEIKSDHQRANDPQLAIPNANAKKSLAFGLFTWLFVGLSIALNVSRAIIPLMSLIFPLLQLVFAIIAISYANLAKKEIDLNPGKFDNRGAAILGKALGIAYLILVFIAILFFLFLLLLVSAI